MYSHVNLTIFISWTVKLNPMTLNTLMGCWEKIFFYMEKGLIQGFNLFQFVSNWSLRFWTLNCHLKWLLISKARMFLANSHIHNFVHSH